MIRYTINGLMVYPSALPQTPPRLLNRYSIKKTLGARLGRRTLLGYDHSRNRQVIIKYLCYEDPLQPSDIRRFRQEAEVLQTLAHPAIPAYCDSFDINDHGYHGLMLVQDYIEGQSLYALVNARRFFTEADLRALAGQVLAILDYLHSQEPAIIHRDIKPSSLVLSEPPNTKLGDKLGQVYLVDFGLVQRAHAPGAVPNEPILISGTPGYRPLEQLGDRAVPATDLYSLGATLVHLATGQHPTTLPQRGLRMLFSQELGHINRPLKAWLRWLTQPKQHKRPTSARTALRGLERAEEIFAPAYRLSASLGQRCQRTLLETLAPANTQLKLMAYSQTLEILLPTVGWKTSQFCRALLQTATGVLGLGLIIYGILSLEPKLGIGQQLFAAGIGLGWTYLSLCYGYQGLKRLLTTLFRQVSIQLLPDIILLGYRFPCRPVNYQINTYKQDIDDIDLQPGSSVITFRLRCNRTVIGKLEYTLSGQTQGLNQVEVSWINDILQLWLKQRAPQGLV
ncbi:MAG: serine/threonine-protein kinase [Cyanobacteria bacterium P01_H01_bin.26]